MRLRSVKAPKRPKRASKNLYGLYLKLLDQDATLWRSVIVRDQLSCSSFSRAVAILMEWEWSEPKSVQALGRGAKYALETRLAEIVQGIGDEAIITFQRGAVVLRLESMQPQVGDEPRLAVCVGGEGRINGLEFDLTTTNERLAGPVFS